MAYTQELDDVAEWFENCHFDEMTGKTVAKIIRKWKPYPGAPARKPDTDTQAEVERLRTEMAHITDIRRVRDEWLEIALKRKDEIANLVKALKRSRQCLGNLAEMVLTGEYKEIAWNEAQNIHAALAPFQAGTEGVGGE